MGHVRVRFAPSPTGHLHIGNARTAILNWIYARQTKGSCVLRIEDTDVERSTAVSEQSIYEDLHWLGLDYDEGPEQGGDFGPYRQSERLHLYGEYLEKLQRSGHVYPCYFSDDELEKIRNASIKNGEAPYQRRKLEHTTEQINAFEAAGRKPAWFFDVHPGEIKWHDLIKGNLAMDGENVGDFVVVRSNNMPTYNFAAVIDDALMQITHVIRGDDHVSNTPKQILLYEALGFNLPEFAHTPMILGPDRTRLSKRHGATSINEFQHKGYLPQVLINFLSLLSWSSESGDELLSQERLIKEFDFKRMSTSPAIFDTVKLNWMNGQYVRALPVEKLLELAEPFLSDKIKDAGNREKLAQVLRLIQKNIETLDQVQGLVEPFFQERIQPRDGQAIEVSSKDSSQKVYWAFIRALQNVDELNADTFRSIMKEVQQESGIMGKDLWMPIRVALTGQIHGPELPMVAQILGKETCEKFVRHFVD